MTGVKNDHRWLVNDESCDEELVGVGQNNGEEETNATRFVTDK